VVAEQQVLVVVDELVLKGAVEALAMGIHLGHRRQEEAKANSKTQARMQ